MATEPTPYPLLTALSKHLTIKAYTLFEVVANPGLARAISEEALSREILNSVGELLKKEVGDSCEEAPNFCSRVRRSEPVRFLGCGGFRPCARAFVELEIFIDAFDSSALGHPAPIGAAARVVALTAADKFS
jgi:hypothetical protein